MKKILVGLIIIVFCHLVKAEYYTTELVELDTIYPRTAIVTEINYETDTVVVTDNVGYMWEFTEVDDWCLGDIASMIMDTKGTESITDDVILSVRYNGNLK